MYAGMKWAIIAAISTVSLAVTADESWAQRRGRGGGRGGSGWSIGIGPGGVYGGYNSGGWRGNGGWYGNRGGWYGNRGWYGGGGYYGGNYYYPNYNYGYNSGYYYPSYSYGGTVYTTPGYSSGSVVTNAPPMRTGSGGDVVIMNSQENGTALNYSLNGHNYTIQPGQTQRIANDRQWIVEFDRGSGEGTARYSLTEGKFKFKSTDNGWELVRAADQAASTQTTAKPPLDTINEPPPRTFDDEGQEPRRSERNRESDRDQESREDTERNDSLESAPEPQ